MKLAGFVLVPLVSIVNLSYGIVVDDSPEGSDRGGFMEVPDETRRELWAEEPEQPTLMPVCPYNRTFNDNVIGQSRGFYFTAPTDFCIVGLSVPNEFDDPIQNVQVFILDEIPSTFPFPTIAEGVFHAPNQNASNVIPAEIQVKVGDVVGLLGTTGNFLMRNSYCADTLNVFNTTIGEYPVQIDRLLAQVNINHHPARAIYTSQSEISRVNMFYKLGFCPKRKPKRAGKASKHSTCRTKATKSRHSAVRRRGEQ